MKDLHKHDNFLADAIKAPRQRQFGYLDGFRFGIGFFISGLLIAVVLGGLTWGTILLFHVQ